MSHRRQFFVICTAVFVLCSSLNYAAVHLLDIRTRVIDRGVIGTGSEVDAVLTLGSSIGFFGISFRQVSNLLNRPLITRSIGGCSPSELEVLAREVPSAARVIIAVSLFDLNENNICDSRALVSLPQTIRDLHDTGAGWSETKRILWTYPVPWLQTVFPLAGRSNVVLVGLRDRFRQIRGRGQDATVDPKLTFKTDKETSRPERLSDWDHGRIVRNLSQLHAAGLAAGRYGGTKMRALGRIVERGSQPPIVLVMPMSLPYKADFATPAATEAFESALQVFEKLHPAVRLIRLDRAPTLQSSDVFWDLVHLNDAGRAIATDLMLRSFERGDAR